MDKGKTKEKSKLDNFFLEKLSKTDRKLTNIRKYLKRLETEFTKQKISDINLPLNIFKLNLTVFECIVKYLKEEYNLNYHEISELVNRDERNIWSTYKRACKKQSKRISRTKSRLAIPISVFKSSKTSFLESIVFYLKEHYKLRFSQIAHLIKRDSRTVWTVYQRAKRKNEQ